MLNLINNLPPSEGFKIKFSTVTYDDSVAKLHSFRSDCSSGYDSISFKNIKPVIDDIASPLTFIINSGIKANYYHNAWKIQRITPVPKINTPTEFTDYRPVSILPILWKVYERLICKQIVSYIDDNLLYKPTMSGFRRNHSTTTLLLKIREDIMKAIEKGEVTLTVFADFSKAFDTVDFSTILTKLHQLNFLTDSLKWFLSYFSDRYQFVQIDDKKSVMKPVFFGVP